MDDSLIAELTRLAASASPAARAWIGKHLASHIRENRPKRRRGIQVRIGSARGPKAVLDEERVHQLEDWRKPTG